MAQLDAPKLQRLYLGANQIKSVAGLENKGHVSLVHLRGNAIETLTGLSAETKKLTYLNLR
jgi:hypothetical protein